MFKYLVSASILFFTPAYAQLSPERKLVDDRPTKENTDKDGLSIIERETDLDWKDPQRVSIDWSKLIRVTSKLNGNYYYVVFDRDYQSDSRGLTQGLLTRWTNDTVTGYQYIHGGCGFWSCTRIPAEIREFRGAIEFFYGDESFLVYGNDGEYILPQKFINQVVRNSGSGKLSIKLSEGRGTNLVFPIGDATLKTLAQMFKLELKSYKAPKVSLVSQDVHDTNQSAEDVVPKVLPSVVTIKSDRASGSGFVFTENGLIMTNRHVISGTGIAKYQIITDSDQRLEAKLIYVDKKLDFAVLEPISTIKIKPLPICYANYPKPGQDVIAIGSPAGIAGTVSKGVVSAVRKPVEQLKGQVPEDTILVQHDAAISPGNSGGPLVNAKGEVLGVNTWGITRLQNVNFAISIVDVLKQLEVSKPIIPAKAKLNSCGNY